MAHVPANYYPGPNPFGMNRPPQWWLNELHLFDSELVLIPGQSRMTYVLARKARFSGGEQLHTVKGVSQQPDTVFLNKHKLVRVCEILAGTIWDQRIFQKLGAHDIRRQGGARKVADTLDARDEKTRVKLAQDQNDELHARSVEAYRGYAHRTGSRLSMVPNRHGLGTAKPNPVSVRVGTTSPAAVAA